MIKAIRAELAYRRYVKSIRQDNFRTVPTPQLELLANGEHKKFKAIFKETWKKANP